MDLANWLNIVNRFIQLVIKIKVLFHFNLCILMYGVLFLLLISGFRFFVTFVDDYSRTTWVYLLKQKNDVFAAFKSFHFMVSTHFTTPIKIMRSDNGGEYISHDFSSFLDASAIVHQITCPSTPKQNGVTKRKLPFVGNCMGHHVHHECA